jgi:histidine triad (HIT) family protein
MCAGAAGAGARAEGREVTDNTIDCLFCRIVKGELPADVVLENEACVAFRDINPQAPTHVVVVPRSHRSDLAALVAADPELAAALVATCTEVASAEGLTGVGHRIVFNTGAGAGQTVFHVHGHVLGGRRMTWPPG